MKKKKIICAIVAAGIIVAAILLVSCRYVTIKEENGWICAWTGSRKGNTTWFGCFTVSDWYRKSPTEEWLANNNRPIEHKWLRTKWTMYGINFKHFIDFRAPAVYIFPAELQERFLSTASAEEIEALLEMLRGEDQEKIREEIEQLCERLLKDM